MARETLHLVPGWRAEKEERTVAVEYREIPHFYSQPSSGRKIKQYEVFVDGVKVGKVYSHEYTSSTNWAGTRLRRDLGTSLKWAWSRTGKIRKGERRDNYPGLYSNTRRGAVVDMLGYGMARVQRVKREGV